MSAADEILAPLVEDKIEFSIFQCKSCFQICGDTSTLLYFNREFSFVTVEKKSDTILIDSELITSKAKFDYGSTFNMLICCKCNESVGRCYRTTTPELDNLRGRFSFNLNNIQLYEIIGMNQQQPISADNVSQKASNVDQVEITKLQKFSLALYDRLEQLEAENDMLKTELMSISKKIEDGELGTKRAGSIITGHSVKAPKSRKSKDRRDENEFVSENITAHKPITPLKAIAASIASKDFDTMSTSVQANFAESFDEDMALETVSWAILNSGKLQQFQKEISF